ncbi:uroporphyrinogen-III C-methyltransferase [Dongshaea marina]|uniref:uroporphyrinogen-III C-methyltransferase n=1 Tax=Dongshaea marina TaxID=2047966 RepID=UPI000D3E8123|nr:uroporphyrinogen-III C-methyltransferase [Dongshaea marina]
MTAENKNIETSAAKGSSSKPATSNKGALLPKISLLVSILALLLAIVIGGSLLWLGKERVQQQAMSNLQVDSQLTQEKTAREQLSQTLQQTRQQLDEQQQDAKQLSEVVGQLRAQLREKAQRTPANWVLSEADYLLKMAGHKLWLQHDVPTAILLLNSADERILSLHDPSLIPLRRTIANDITQLQALHRPDREGIALRLGALVTQIDKLELAHPYVRKQQDAQQDQLSSQVADWKQNLVKSWHHFINDFVTVQRQDGQVKPLLSPSQNWYLRQNLRLMILQAQQAVYQEQPELYRQSLADARQWVAQYFSANDPKAQGVIRELDQLIKQPVSVEYPKQLKSLPQLEGILQQRLSQGGAITPRRHNDPNYHHLCRFATRVGRWPYGRRTSGVSAALGGWI